MSKERSDLIIEMLLILMSEFGDENHKFYFNRYSKIIKDEIEQENLEWERRNNS